MQIVRPNERTVEEWAEHVGETWRRVAADLVATGARLLAARSELADGEYVLVLARLRMRPETAANLIAVSECDRISAGDTRVLPRSLDALLKLSQMSDGEWDLAEESGFLSSDLTQAQVRKFRKAAARSVEQDDVERVTAARADPGIPVDPAAQAAFKREAAFLGTLDRLERYIADADQDQLAQEFDARLRAYAAPRLDAVADWLKALAGMMGDDDA